MIKSETREASLHLVQTNQLCLNNPGRKLFSWSAGGCSVWPPLSYAAAASIGQRRCRVRRWLLSSAANWVLKLNYY